LPAKEIGIKLSRAGLIGRVQVRPAERAVRSGDACAGVLVGLPETEDRSGGILHNGHATGIENVKGRSQDGATKFGGAGSGCVRAIDGYVELPVGRNAVGALFGTKGTACGSVASLKPKNRIEVVGRSEERRVGKEGRCGGWACSER